MTQPSPAPGAPVSIPVTSETARDTLQYTFGLHTIGKDIIAALGYLPVFQQTKDPRVAEDIETCLRRALRHANELAGAGKPTAAATGLTSQRPAPVSPQEALNEVV